MRSRLAISALMIASLLGATAIASAQTQPAPGASGERGAGPGVAKPGMKTDKMKSAGTRHSRTTRSAGMKTGTTTGMGSGAANRAARHKSGEGNVGPGLHNNAGEKSGGMESSPPLRGAHHNSAPTRISAQRPRGSIRGECCFAAQSGLRAQPTARGTAKVRRIPGT